MAKPFKYLTVTKAGTPRPPAFGGDEFGTGDELAEYIKAAFPSMKVDNAGPNESYTTFQVVSQAGRPAETNHWKDGIYANFEVNIPPALEHLNGTCQIISANSDRIDTWRFGSFEMLGARPDKFEDDSRYVKEKWPVFFGGDPCQTVLMIFNGEYICSCQNYRNDRHATNCRHIIQVLSIKLFAKLCLANRANFPAWNLPPSRDYSRFAFLESK
jgi:hypothetical protein